MAEDKRKGGAADRRKVAAGEEHEVAYFARKHGISKEQTLDLSSALETTAKRWMLRLRS
jgi:hypothetical protein